MKYLFAVMLALLPGLAFGQAMNWGEYIDNDQTEYVYFNTIGSDGVAETLTSGSAAIIEDGSTTTITTATTITANFNSVVGLHQIAVDFADAGFEDGKTYTVILTGGTVDGVGVTGRVVGTFNTRRVAFTQMSMAISGLETTVSEMYTAINGLFADVAEPTGIPDSAATMQEMVSALYFALLRNRMDIDEGNDTITYYDDSGTPIYQKTTSDDGSVFTKGEVEAIP